MTSAYSVRTFFRITCLWLIDLFVRLIQSFCIIIPAFLVGAAWLKRNYKVSVYRMIVAAIVLGTLLFWTGVASYAAGMASVKMIEDPNYSPGVRIIGLPVFLLIIFLTFYLPPTYLAGRILRALRPIVRKTAPWKQYTS